MATSFRQKAFQRKLIYFGVVIVLFCCALIWRKGVVEAQANEMALREQNMGEVELVGVIIRNALIGSKGFVTCGLWIDAIEKKKKNQWNELELTTRALTRLQPNMISPWRFQCWNLTFNVSVESDRIRDKYYWIARGIMLMGEGVKKNKFSPMLRQDLGFFQTLKICRSDENNVMRSLCQLSCIPPKERDPERFWLRDAQGEIQRLPDGSRAFNVDAFRDFCLKHPQLIRRLVAPPLTDDPRRERPKFACTTAQEVIDFLAENQTIPGLFATKLEDPQAFEEYLPKAKLEERFPVLPPTQDFTYYPGKDGEWDYENILIRPRDHFNGYQIGRAWYGYAQELLPPPHPTLATENAPITDRARQRLPKMETILFRIDPVIAQKQVAERYAEEGWFDQSPWELSLEYQKTSIGQKGKTIDATLGEANLGYSQQAWIYSYEMWDAFGRRNNLILDESRLSNLQQDEKLFRKIINPKEMRDGYYQLISTPRKDPEEERLRQSAQILHLNRYGRSQALTRFENQLRAAEVEKDENTVQARKLFYEAERIRRNRSLPALAMEKFDEAAKYWRAALREHPKYLEETHIEEEIIKHELKYVRLYADLYGTEQKQQLALQNYLGQALSTASFGSEWSTLGMVATPTQMPTIIVYGPFAKDYEANKDIPFYTKHYESNYVSGLKLTRKAATLRPGKIVENLNSGE